MLSLPVHPTAAEHSGRHGEGQGIPTSDLFKGHVAQTTNGSVCVRSHHAGAQKYPLQLSTTEPTHCSRLLIVLVLLLQRSNVAEALLRQAESSLWLWGTKQPMAKHLGKFCSFYMPAPVPSPGGLPGRE